jgi:hypothetical protein
MKTDEKLSQVFDIEPVIEGEIITKNNEVIVPKGKHNENIDYDYEKSRSNLHALLQSGQEALMHALEVAKSSEHPRAFEVVGNLVKQLADVNQQLLSLHSQKQKLDNPGKNNESTVETKTVTNNNAIFVGSTAELNKIINDMK